MPSSSPGCWSARERLIGALLVGNNVATIAASALATGLMLNWFGDVGVIYATVVMTVLVVVFCEVLPKTAAINLARPLRARGRAADRRGGARARAGADRGLLAGRAGCWRAFGFRIGENEPMLSPHEELRGAVDLLHREGGVEKLDRDMLGGLLDLRDLTVADVMIHRTEVIMVDAGEPPEQAVEAVLAAPVTRVPLWATRRRTSSASCTPRTCCARCAARAATPRRSISRRSRGRPGSCRRSGR